MPAGQKTVNQNISSELKDLLMHYYTLSRIPVCLFIGKNNPILDVSSGELSQAKLCSDYAAYPQACIRLMRQCDKDKTVVKDMIAAPDADPAVPPLSLAVYPIIFNDTVQGYLMLYTCDANSTVFDAACGLLPAIGNHIGRNGIQYVMWKTYIDEFRQFIYTNADKDMDIQTLAAGLKTSKTQLYESFHTYIGMPFAKYVKKIRLEKACDLLSQTDMSVTEISSAVGFNDYNYFCRTFKKEIGMPANRYRMIHAAKS